MRFLADECVSGHIVRLLRDRRHDVLWIKESGPGASDEDVLQDSVTGSRVLLTEDRGFGEQAVRFEKPALGIVVVAIPATRGDAEEIARVVVQKLDELEEGLIGRLTILEKRRVRQRDLVS